MGNACFCSNGHYIDELRVNICLDKQSMNGVTELVPNKEVILNEKGINELKKYFYGNKNEKEIINNFNFKEMSKDDLNIKKRKSILGTMIDSQYELMLRRLLEQKNIKRIGPKRRETIRKEDKIKELINEVIVENKNENKNKKNENKLIDTDSSIIIKNNNISKVKLSVIVGKNDQLINILNNKADRKVKNKKLKNVKTLNENTNANEGCGSSVFCKKETNKK